MESFSTSFNTELKAEEEGLDPKHAKTAVKWEGGDTLEETVPGSEKPRTRAKQGYSEGPEVGPGDGRGRSEQRSGRLVSRIFLCS